MASPNDECHLVNGDCCPSIVASSQSLFWIDALRCSKSVLIHKCELFVWVVGELLGTCYRPCRLVQVVSTVRSMRADGYRDKKRHMVTCTRAWQDLQVASWVALCIPGLSVHCRPSQLCLLYRPANLINADSVVLFHSDQLISRRCIMYIVRKRCWVQKGVDL